MTRREAGYTLLEMLVALVVFGLIMAGIAQTFRFGLTAWSAGTRNTAEPEDLAAADAALMRMIGQAQPGSITGYPNGIAFTTRLPAGAGLGEGLADVALKVAPGGGLILSYAPHQPGVALGPPPKPQIEPLAAGVTALATSYLVPQPGGPPSWSTTWSGDGVPLLVRLHVELASGRSWPDLVMAPHG